MGGGARKIAKGKILEVFTFACSNVASVVYSSKRVTSSSSSARHALARNGSGASGALHAGFRAAQVCFHACICAHRVLARRSTFMACPQHARACMCSLCWCVLAQVTRLSLGGGNSYGDVSRIFNHFFEWRAAGALLWCRVCVSDSLAARA